MAYKNDLKEHLLVDLHELLIPLLDVGGLLARVGVIVLWCWWIVLVVLAPFDNLLQDRLVDLCENVSRVSRMKPRRGGELTFGMGMAASISPPPRSSSMCLISIDLSATARSAKRVSLLSMCS